MLRITPTYFKVLMSSLLNPVETNSSSDSGPQVDSRLDDRSTDRGDSSKSGSGSDSGIQSRATGDRRNNRVSLSK